MKPRMLLTAVCLLGLLGVWSVWLEDVPRAYGQNSWYGPIQSTWTRTQSIPSNAQAAVGDPVGRYGKDGHLSVTVSNTGSAALADFIMEYRNHSTGPWHIILADADWMTPSATLPMVGTASPATLAAGASTHFVVNLYGADAVRFTAAAATGGTDVTLYGTFQLTPSGQ